jgi:tetratricopeptide (TPR) repeat protein
VAFKDGSGRYVWSERYDLSLKSWERTQRDIVRKIAAGLGVYLSTERLTMRGGGGDVSLTAYDKWLKGEHLLSAWSGEAEREAELLFQQVNSEMPQFAPAYSSLAGIYNVRHLIHVGTWRDPPLEARAMELAQRAVGIDPLDARAHLTLAWSYSMASRFHQAELHYGLAIQLNPNHPATLVSCAQGLAFTGRCAAAMDAAREALKLAHTLHPYQWAYLACARFICGDYEGCIDASLLAGHAIVDVAGWKAAALAHEGRREEAAVAGRELVSDIRSAWTGSPAAEEAELIRWMLHGYPIKDESTLDRLREGLRLALVAV